MDPHSNEFTVWTQLVDMIYCLDPRSKYNEFTVWTTLVDVMHLHALSKYIEVAV